MYDRSRWVLFFAATLATLSLPALARADDATALLRAAISAPAHVSYVGEVQIFEIGKSASKVSVYRVEHRSPDATRRWYLAPRSIYGDTTIARGDTTYAVDVNRHRVVVAKNDALDDRFAIVGNVTLLLNNYRAVLGPNANVAGRGTRVVMLMNRYTGAMTMRLHIDTRTHLLLESERFGATGALIDEMRFESLRIVSGLPSRLFAIPTDLPKVIADGPRRPSNDIAKAAQQAGFAMHEPHYLPDGFEAVATDVSKRDGINTLHVLYSDGLRTVSLFESKTNAKVDMHNMHVQRIHVGNDMGNYATSGATGILGWSDHGLRYELVGELSQHELVRIGASVEP